MVTSIGSVSWLLVITFATLFNSRILHSSHSFIHASSPPVSNLSLILFTNHREIHPLARKLPPAIDRALSDKQERANDWQRLHELEGPRLSSAAARLRLIKIDRRLLSLLLSVRHLPAVLILPTGVLVFKAEIDSCALLFLTRWCRHVDAPVPRAPLPPTTTAAPQLGTSLVCALTQLKHCDWDWIIYGWRVIGLLGHCKFATWKLLRHKTRLLRMWNVKLLRMWMLRLRAL